MGLTRRNTIIALGVIAGGAGVIGGTGAFDVVEADRSFEVAVAGDAAGILGLEVHNSVIAGTESGGAGGNDVIFFELDAAETASEAPAINEDAITRFFGVFSITNHGSQTVMVTLDAGDADGVTFNVITERADNADVLSEDTTLGAGVELTPGNTVHVDIEIDTTPSGGYTEPTEPYDMTIRAESSAAQE